MSIKGSHQRNVHPRARLAGYIQPIVSASLLLASELGFHFRDHPCFYLAWCCNVFTLECSLLRFAFSW